MIDRRRRRHGDGRSSGRARSTRLPRLRDDRGGARDPPARPCGGDRRGRRPRRARGRARRSRTGRRHRAERADRRSAPAHSCAASRASPICPASRWSTTKRAASSPTIVGDYTAITMSLIDTWASTGTGAYSLSENGLYTVEAWRTFMRRLDQTASSRSRAGTTPRIPGETARMLALALDTPWQSGAQNARDAPHPAAEPPGRDPAVVAAARSRRRTSTRSSASRASAASAPDERRASCPISRCCASCCSQPSRDALREWSSTRSCSISRRPTIRARSSSTCCGPRTGSRRVTIDKLDLRFLGNLPATQSLLYAMLVSLLLTLAAGLADARALAPSCACCRAPTSPPRSATSR